VHCRVLVSLCLSWARSLHCHVRVSLCRFVFVMHCRVRVVLCLSWARPLHCHVRVSLCRFVFVMGTSIALSCPCRFVFVMGMSIALSCLCRFVFVMGTSVALSFNAARRRQVPRLSLLRRILRRTVILFILGLVVSNRGELSSASIQCVVTRCVGLLQGDVAGL